MLILPRVYILISFVLWNLKSGSAAAINSGTFQQPSTNTDSRFTAIQNELLKVQGDMLVLSTALQSGDNSQDIKARLSTVEAECESLKQQLQNERAKSMADNGAHESSITVLTNYFNTLDRQLKDLKASIEQKATEDARRQMPSVIADEIRSHRFAEAQALITKMNDNSKIQKIVNEVYANSQANTDVLLDFAKALTTVESSFYVLKALHYEMRANGHRDPYKMIALARKLKSEVISQGRVSSETKAKAEDLLNETLGALETVATETLKAAMYTDRYEKNVQVETLANSLHDFDEDVSDGVMQRLVDETWGSVSATKIAEGIYSNKYIPQIVAGLWALYRKFESSNDMEDRVLLKIRLYCEKLKAMANYRNMKSSKQSQVEHILNKIPNCADYVMYPPKICGAGLEEPLSYLPVVGLPFAIGKLFS